MQGETISCILCTSSWGTISKETYDDSIKYREKIDIPKLGYVDDTVDIQKCGKSTKDMNEKTSKEFNKRKLQLHGYKCHQMHIWKEQVCETLEIDNWTLKKRKENDKTTLVDTHEGKVAIDTVKSQTYLGECIQISGSNSEK